MTRILLIGCGRIGAGVHLPAIQMLEQQGLVELAGLCDLDSKRAAGLATQHRVKFFGGDWERVAEEAKADAVSVCLPPGPNAEVARRAVKKGLHVICEKPPGRAVAEAEAMAEAAIERPVVVTMVAFNRRYSPLYTKALRLSRALGNPSTFCARFTRGRLGSQPGDTAEDWITSDGAHALDLAIATLGFPDSFIVNRNTTGIGPHNVWQIQFFRERSGAMILFDFGAGRRLERFEWTGPGYDVLLELPDRGEWSQHDGTLEQWQAEKLTGSSSSVVNYGFREEYRSFLEAIAGSAPRPSCDFGYAARYMRLVSAILLSPKGSLCPVAVHDRGNGPSRVAPAPVEVTTMRAGDGQRPVITILQDPAVIPKYFAVGGLSALGKQCDVRFQSVQGRMQDDIAQSDVIMLGWDAPPLSVELAKLAVRLKLAIVLGASVKPAQPELLLPRGVAICNTADAIAKSVAEHCLMLGLAGLRKLTTVDKELHAGRWPAGGSTSPLVRKAMRIGRRIPGARALKPFLPRSLIGGGSRGVGERAGLSTDWADLRGQTVGLVGWGHIAMNFALLLQPFACRVIVFSESATDSELAAQGAQRASLGEVLGGSRVVSLHRGMTEKTKGTIGKRELALLRQGTVLINTARAGLIDEDALVARLSKGDIVGAFDVFAEEPLPPGHPLQKLNNVILTPHMSNLSKECYLRVGDEALRIAQDWLAGKKIPLITPARMANMT